MKSPSRLARFVRALEDRIVPATFTVTNTNDSGSGSFRQAVIAANSSSGADTIVFEPSVFSNPQTVLLSGTIGVVEALAIIGPGPGLLTISGNSKVSPFDISAAPTNTPISFSGLKFTDTIEAALTCQNEALTVTNCVFMNNTGGGSSGAITAYNASAIVKVFDSLFANNNGDYGPGIRATAPQSLVIEGCTFTGNQAKQNGGAIHVTSTSAGITLRNTTISNNTAIGDGGGIELESFAGKLTIQNSTITGNSASGSFGGGGISRVSGSGSIEIVSSIVSNNSHSTGDYEDLFTGGSVTATLSAIGTAKYVSGFMPDTLTKSLMGMDFKLGPLTNNGGLTLTHALLPDSPCINVGSNPANLPYDQRGASRNFGTGVDIGSFEYVPSNSLVDLTSDNDDGNYGPGNLTLREAISIANASPGPDTITFSSLFDNATTITLNGTPLPAFIDKVHPTTIKCPGANLLTIDANQLSRIFQVSSSVTVNIDGVKLTGGKLTSLFAAGGGISNAGTLTLTNSILSGCTAVAGGGGIINGGNLTVLNSTISDNRALYYYAGGGLRNSGTVTISNSTLSGNSAGKGGGIANYGTMFVTNSTVNGNSSTGKGGGILSFRFDPTPVQLTVINSTVSANSASEGGGIFNGGNSMNVGSLQLTNTIVAGNSAMTGNDVKGSIAPASTNNLIDMSALSAGLGTFGNYGGPTFTIPLLPGSPAINAGLSSGAPMTDQRGLPRVGAVDIGAFEVQVLPPTATIQIADGSAQRSSIRLLTITFSETVNFPDGMAAAIQLQRVGPGAPTGTVVLDTQQAGNVVSVLFNDPTFAAGTTKSLIDGNYNLTLVATKITGLGGSFDGNNDGKGGDDAQVSFHRLFGDSNGDRVVNSTDFAAFRLVFGTNNAVFDFDGDTNVGAGDFAAFRLRFGIMLDP